MWEMFKNLTHINTFVYDEKRILIDLEDEGKVYCKVKHSDVDRVCLQVPLKSWTRFRTARMSDKIISKALQILERHEKNKHRSERRDENEPDQMMSRIIRMERTLKVMEATLKTISSKLTVNKIKPKSKRKRNRKSTIRKSITKDE